MNNIYEKLKEKYNNFDSAHGVDHINTVIENALLINKKLGYPYKENVILIAALYHDIGMIVDRKTHHLESAKYVLSDDEILEHVTEEERYLISKACEEHRASYNGEFTSLLSKIINDADSMTDVITMVTRSIQYSLSVIKENESLYDKVYSHLKEKYGRNGYCKFKLEISYEINNTEELWKILENEVLFEHEFHKAITLLKEEGKVEVYNV